MLERIRSLASVLFGYDSPPLEVQLSSPQELQTLYSTRFGLNTQPQACYTDESDHPRILVQQGLPEEALFVVLAHEFGHAWQANEGFSGGSVEQREGFAQWVAYRISEADGRDAQTLFESCTGLEASGLRKFISLEEKFGLVGVLKAAKSKNLNLKVLR